MTQKDGGSGSNPSELDAPPESRGLPPRSPRDQMGSDDAEIQASDLGSLASQALLARPGISLRVRLIMGLSVIFVVALGVVIVSWLILSQVDDRLEFVERSDKFTNEIQQCRRYEKNYFLYGTGRAQLIEHLRSARRTLTEAKVELSRVVGSSRLRKLENHLEAYSRIVDQLLARRPRRLTKGVPNKQIEAALREHGSRLVSTAILMSRQERTNVRRNLHLMRQVTMVMLAVFLVVMLLIANFMARHLLARLRHLNGVLKRVGEGDFSPIMPLRKYKDEFTTLAVTLNRVMAELLARQEQLVQSRKIAAVGTLTAGIAHEINNPVNNISLVLESLIDDDGTISDEERRRLLREAMGQSDRVADIVKNLLEFSRSNHPRRKQFSLEALIDTTVRLVSNEMKLREIRFNKQVRSTLPELYLDKGGMHQVLLNMFLNAMHAMPHGGLLTVGLDLSDDEQEAILEIADTGNGIDPAHLVNIFDPFFTTKKDSEGTGLGLSVSYSIIHKHGGRIEVDSRPGEGTVFTISLPLEETAPNGTTR